MAEKWKPTSGDACVLILKPDDEKTPRSQRSPEREVPGTYRGQRHGLHHLEVDGAVVGFELGDVTAIHQAKGRKRANKGADTQTPDS